MTCYRASRQFIWAGLVALAITVFSGWVALDWPYAWIAFGLALFSAILFFVLTFRPVIEIHEACLKIGARAIPWTQIRRLDRVMLVPLLVKLTTADKKQRLLVYAGNAEGANSLLRQLRRYSREALINGVPHRQFWGETPRPAPERKQLAPPRYPLLLPDDEAEVERMFQRLKAVGNLDQKSGADES